MLLIHQIAPRPAYLRVKVGRHLQRIGAVPIKHSVYAMPAGDEAQEDLQWVLREVAKGGGHASVVEARFVGGLSSEQVVGLFQAAQAREVGATFPKGGVPPANRRAEVAGQVARLRQRLGQIEAIDFLERPDARWRKASWLDWRYA